MTPQEFQKDFVNTYKSYFENNGFKLDKVVNKKDNEHSISGFNMIFTDDATYKLVLSVTIYDDYKGGYRCYRELTGEINERAIKRVRTMDENIFIPTKFVSQNWFKSVRKTIENKKFSKADAIIAINKNLLINKNWGDYGNQEYMVQLNDNTFFKIFRTVFMRQPAWSTGFVYQREGKYKLTMVKTGIKIKSFPETEEGINEMIDYVKQINKWANSSSMLNEV